MSPRSDFAGLGNNALAAHLQNHILDSDKPTSTAPKQDLAHPQSFEVTNATEVKLDGRSCKLQDVPTTAAVVSIELAPDGKTILNLIFKSKQLTGAER